MKKLALGLLFLALSASPARAAGLKLTIHDGKVSIDAQDVTIRQILTEWARLGKTRIVNLERVNSGPLTVQFEGLPEKQALDIILRSVPGYMAAPRTPYVADASVYDRILIMATTTTVAAPPAPRTSASQNPQPNVTQLRAAPPALLPGALPETDDYAADQQDDPAIAAAAAAGLIAVPAQSPGATSFNPFVPGGAQRPALASPPDPSATPTATPTTATPSNPWNAPAWTARPSLAPPTPPQQPSRPTLLAPPQADR